MNDDEERAERLRLVDKNSPAVKDLYVRVEQEEEYVALTEALRDNTHVEFVDIIDVGENGEHAFALWKQFCQALGSLHSLRELSVHRGYADEDHTEDFNEDLEDAFAKRLAYLLRKTTQVRELEIDSCWCDHFEFGQEVEVTQWNTPRMVLIAKEIMGHPSLEDFTFLDFTVDQPATIDSFASAVCTVPNLRKFHLKNCWNDPAELFNALFVHRLVAMPTLRDLALKCFVLQDSHIDALGSDHSTNVETLSLSDCRLTAGRITNLLPPGSNLKDLQLDNIPLNRDDSVALSEGVQRMATLESLCLKNCFSQSVEHASIIATAIGDSKSLRTFTYKMQGIRCPPVFLHGLADGLKENNSLHTLKLSIQCDEEDGIRDFTSAIRNHTSLTVLDLTRSAFSSAVVASVLNGLVDNATIKEIDLRFCLGSENVDSLLPLLRGNTCCRNLHLYYCPFSDEDYLSILSAIKENSTLEELSFSIGRSNYVSDKTKVAFLVGLAGQGSLKTLNIGYVSNDGQESGNHDEELVEAYRKNYTLECCDLQPSGEKHKSQVEALLRLNKAGRRYLKGNNPSRVKGVAVLEAVKDDLDCLFVHLKENPSLCEVRESQSPARADRKRKRG